MGCWLVRPVGLFAPKKVGLFAPLACSPRLAHSPRWLIRPVWGVNGEGARRFVHCHFVHGKKLAKYDVSYTKKRRFVHTWRRFVQWAETTFRTLIYSYIHTYESIKIQHLFYTNIRRNNITPFWLQWSLDCAIPVKFNAVYVAILIAISEFKIRSTNPTAMSPPVVQIHPFD